MESIRQVFEFALGELAPAPELAPAVAWSLAAGAALAPRARCLSLRDGVLTLEPAAPEAQRQIRSVERELLRELNRMLGPAAVRRLEFAPRPQEHSHATEAR
ncbi:MAG: DciA family protein [Terriglobales bacterium]